MEIGMTDENNGHVDADESTDELIDDLSDERPEEDLIVEGLNQLTVLGNQAIDRGLIIGHGYHRGNYEILLKGEVLTLSPDEAIAYLLCVLAVDGPDGPGSEEA
jgi:hypothetical protein